MMRVARLLAASIALLGSAEAIAAAVSTLLPNTVSIEPVPPEQGEPDPAFAAAVDDVLAARGFTTLPQPGHARLIAAITVTRTEVGTTPSSVRVGGPSAMAGGAAGVGLSAIINLPTGKRQMVPLVRTRLDLRLITRADGKTLWQGSAITIRAATTDARLLASTLAEGVLGAGGDAADDVVAVP